MRFQITKAPVASSGPELVPKSTVYRATRQAYESLQPRVCVIS